MKIVTSRSSSVAMVSRLQTAQPRNRGLVLGRSSTFFTLQRPNRHWESPSLLSGGFFFRGKVASALSYQSPPSSAEVKNAGSYTPTPPYIFMAWCLIKPRDLTFCSALLFTFFVWCRLIFVYCNLSKLGVQTVFHDAFNCKQLGKFIFTFINKNIFLSELCRIVHIYYGFFCSPFIDHYTVVTFPSSFRTVLSILFIPRTKLVEKLANCKMDLHLP
jgi:hypothetical protein